MARDDRTRVGDAPRSATGREWEVFVRPDADGALKHVGSVTATTADAAHERASRLFDWAARDVWLCPADEMRRYTTHSLAGGDDGQAHTGDDGQAHTGGDGESSADRDAAHSQSGGGEATCCGDAESAEPGGESA